MTDEERENYSSCMLILGMAVGTLARIREEGKKLEKTTGFPDFTAIADEALQKIYPFMDEVYKFNNTHP